MGIHVRLAEPILRRDASLPRISAVHVRDNRMVQNRNAMGSSRANPHQDGKANAAKDKASAAAIMNSKPRATNSSRTRNLKANNLDAVINRTTKAGAEIAATALRRCSTTNSATAIRSSARRVAIHKAAISSQ